MTQDPIRVLVVDDHAMVREGLHAFLQWADDVQIVGEAASGRDAIAFTEAETVDVILMDLVMPGELDGIAATQVLSAKSPNIHVIALTSFQDEERILEALAAGAIGYLRKDVSPDDLLTAIRQAAVGRSVLDEAAMQALRHKNTFDTWQNTAQPPQRSVANPLHQTARQERAQTEDVPGSRRAESLVNIEPLTKREEEILYWLAKGYSNKEIGAELGITEKTVKVHVSHVLGKLGVYDRTQAVITATKAGLVTL